METTKERLIKLFNLTDKTKIAHEIDVLLDDFASTVMVRLEREFTFENAEGKFLARSCYVSPPNVGHFITIGKIKWKVVEVIHSFDSNSSGTIILEEVSIL
ncbi:hypothetical protein CHRYSEOSP005_11730 [Chryseobacterium sp. Alg-005]|uniref:hypothetical protein n=1 Tax=Chryseobacterium sp. Alg-005 TaxID=3159516 RepID=UPI0035557E4A